LSKKVWGDDVRIVNLLEVLESKDHYFIIMPFLGRDLADSDLISNMNVLIVARKLIENLQYLKHLGIVHYDISLENIVVHLDRFYQLELPFTNFALAQKCSRNTNGECLPIARSNPPKIYGNKRYMNPEMFYGEDISFGVDLWAIGCILFFLWTGRHLYVTPGDACWQYFILRIANREELLYIERVKRVLALWRQMTNDQQSLLTKIFRLDLQQGE
jgi:serine/threonine-protein kinase PRP4